MTRTATAKAAPAAKTSSTRSASATAKTPSSRKAAEAKKAAPAAKAASAKVVPAAATQVNFRADPETKAALDELTADGTAVSEVIRKAIQDARRTARKAKAVAEMEAIMADPEQRRISEVVYREMSNLSAW